MLKLRNWLKTGATMAGGNMRELLENSLTLSARDVSTFQKESDRSPSHHKHRTTNLTMLAGLGRGKSTHGSVYSVMESKRMSPTKKSGFTLIEVLIVVVILAVLAATVIPQFTDSTTDAKRSSVLFNLHTLRSQIQLYRAHHEGDAPSATLNELLVATNVDGTTTGDTPFGPYLSKIPVNNFTNSDSIKTVTAQPTASDVSETDGWLYNATTGEIWVNHEELLEE